MAVKRLMRDGCIDEGWLCKEVDEEWLCEEVDEGWLC